MSDYVVVGPQRENITAALTDAVSDFLYYDRKECEQVPLGLIESMIKDGNLTINELVATFEKALREGLK